MKKRKTLYLTVLGLFTAIIFMMHFTGLGYIQAGIFSLTLIGIPVAAGAILLTTLASEIWQGGKGMLMGALGGAWLGLMFGVTSTIKGFMGEGELLLQISVWRSLFLWIVIRILVGLFTSLIFYGLSKAIRNRTVSISIACFCCPLLNTVMFLSTLVLLFKDTGYFGEMTGGFNIFWWLVGAVWLNAVVELGVGFIVAAAIAKALDVAIKRIA